MKVHHLFLAALPLVGGVLYAGDSHQDEPTTLPSQYDPMPGTKHKVKPGEEHTNEDGVTVDNDEDSSGNGYIDPENGSLGSSTEVDTQTGFEGDITGIDSNDDVDLGSSNDVNISGTGGSVSVSGGSNVNINNVGPADGGTITVIMSGGATVSVNPGSSVFIQT